VDGDLVERGLVDGVRGGHHIGGVLADREAWGTRETFVTAGTPDNGGTSNTSGTEGAPGTRGNPIASIPTEPREHVKVRRALADEMRDAVWFLSEHGRPRVRLGELLDEAVSAWLDEVKREHNGGRAFLVGGGCARGGPAVAGHHPVTAAPDLPHGQVMTGFCPSVKATIRN
jgi:hypothetical protein